MHDVYRKAGLPDGLTAVPRPTDDVHQRKKFVDMHDFTTNRVPDPVVPASDVKKKMCVKTQIS